VYETTDSIRESGKRNRRGIQNMRYRTASIWLLWLDIALDLRSRTKMYCIAMLLLEFEGKIRNGPCLSVSTGNRFQHLWSLLKVINPLS
jgi:hypothetical protein